jgi:hypothetical protein
MPRSAHTYNPSSTYPPTHTHTRPERYVEIDIDVTTCRTAGFIVQVCANVPRRGVMWCDVPALQRLLQTSHSAVVPARDVHTHAPRPLSWPPRCNACTPVCVRRASRAAARRGVTARHMRRSPSAA